MKKIKDRTGEKHLTIKGCEITIIEYTRYSNCTIQFEDGTIVKNTDYGSVKKGYIRNPSVPSVCGVGYIGKGIYNPTDNKEAYSCWLGMIRRCYDEKSQEKVPTYKGCTVDGRWHNFQNFAQWFEDNYVNEWQLDKDILVKGNKTYSSETCCFVPQEINALFTKRIGKLPSGVIKRGNSFVTKITIARKSIYVGSFSTLKEASQAYKIAKENHIKEVADKWKHLLKDYTYKILMLYEVDIENIL